MSYNPELRAQGQFDYQNASGEVSETGTPGKFRPLDADVGATDKLNQYADQVDGVLATENQNGSIDVGDSVRVTTPESEETDRPGEKPQTNGGIDQDALDVEQPVGEVQVQLEASLTVDDEAAAGKGEDAVTVEGGQAEAPKVGDDVNDSIAQERPEGPDVSVDVKAEESEGKEKDVAVGPDTVPSAENGPNEDDATSKKVKRRSFLESLHFPKFDFPPGRKHHNIGTQTPTTEKEREKEMKKGKVLKEKKPKKSKEKQKDKKGGKSKGKDKKSEAEGKPEEKEVKVEVGGPEVDEDVKVTVALEKEGKESDKDVSKDDVSSKDDGEEEEDKAPDLEWDLEREIRMVEEEFAKIDDLRGDEQVEKPKEEDDKPTEETKSEEPASEPQEPEKIVEVTGADVPAPENPQVVEVQAEVQAEPVQPVLVKTKPTKPRKTVIETGLVMKVEETATPEEPKEIPAKPEENVEVPAMPEETVEVPEKLEETVEVSEKPEETVEVSAMPEETVEAPAMPEESVEVEVTPDGVVDVPTTPDEAVAVEITQKETVEIPVAPEEKPPTVETEEIKVNTPDEPVEVHGVTEQPAEVQIAVEEPAEKPEVVVTEEKPTEPEKETKVSFESNVKPVKIKPKPKRPRSVIETGLVVVPAGTTPAEVTVTQPDKEASVSSLSSSDHDTSKEAIVETDDKSKKPDKKKKKEKEKKEKVDKKKQAKAKDEKEKAKEPKEEKEAGKIEIEKEVTVKTETKVEVVQVQKVEAEPEKPEKRKKEEKEPKEKPKKKEKKEEGEKKEKAKKRKDDETKEDEDEHAKKRKEEEKKKKKDRSPWKLKHKGKARTKSDSSGENVEITVTTPTGDTTEEIEVPRSDVDTTRSEGDASDTRLLSVSTLSSEGDRTPTDGDSLRPLSQASEPEGGDTSPPVSPSSPGGGGDSPFEDTTTKKDVIEIRPISPISTTSEDSTLRPTGQIITEEELKKPEPKQKEKQPSFKFRTFPRSSTPKKPKRKGHDSHGRRSLDAEDVATYMIEGSMPVHLPEPASKNYKVVVAIDFGTTFSGYAYSFTKEHEVIHIMRKWEGGDPGVSNMKTPTTLLLTADGHFHSFGFTARDFYHDLGPSESKKWLYFDKFKMTLHSSQDLDSKTELTAVNGKKLPAIEIFAYALKFFKEHALQELNDQSEEKIKNEDIRWVITVPAIWRQPAKQFMREAAYKAGISSKAHPEQLLIALEPEAASIYIRKMRLHEIIPDPDDNNRFSRYRTGCRLSSGPINVDFMHGTKYMVVDCGGGTVDITVHELEEHLGTLKELHKAAGGEYGSVSIDHAFEQVLIDIFTADYIDEFKMKRPAGWVDLMIAFEARKRNASPWKNNPLNVSLPFSFIDYYKKYTKTSTVENAVKKYSKKDIKWSSQGMLRFTPEAMRTLFTPTLHHICGEIEVVLKKPGLDNINYLFLVGGFAESPLLQDEVRRAFSDNVRVIIPQDVGLTILKGAVLYGIDPNVVRVRRSPLTYGVGVLNKFVQGKHPEAKLIEKDGVSWCTDIFDEFVIADQPIAVGETVTRSYTPAKPNQKSTVINIYCTDKQRAMFITDEGIKKCGTLHIDMSDSTYMQMPRRREIQISMQFGDTEIKVSALDVVTGKCVKAGIDFLRK
ncbi:enolase-phosphatase E1-like isoform X2 [Ptychodera flava]|uniref:enolase-phosphatase E1-like isoform X2 n=1 Tax=Ptychodera flava TaxID=63121 RepID=UPI00396A4599